MDVIPRMLDLSMLSFGHLSFQNHCCGHAESTQNAINLIQGIVSVFELSIRKFILYYYTQNKKTNWHIKGLCCHICFELYTP